MIEMATFDCGVEHRLTPSLIPVTSRPGTSWLNTSTEDDFRLINLPAADKGGFTAASYAKYIGLLERFVSNTLNVYWGTGGEPRLIEPTLHNPVSASGAFITVEVLPQLFAVADSSDTVQTEVARQITFVRHYFSLSTTDLARLLLVERPTVYAWLDGKWEPNQENRTRIRKLFLLASSWQGISKQPIGKFLREPVDGESSLMDYLVRQQLDTVKVTDLMNLIHAQIDQKVRSKRARSVGMVAKQSGFKPLSSAQEDESFDRVTKL